MSASAYWAATRSSLAAAATPPSTAPPPPPPPRQHVAAAQRRGPPQQRYQIGKDVARATDRGRIHSKTFVFKTSPRPPAAPGILSPARAPPTRRRSGRRSCAD